MVNRFFRGNGWALLEHRLFPFKSRFFSIGSWEQSIHESFISNFGILGLEMISDSCIYVPARQVLMSSSKMKGKETDALDRLIEK